jgi:hypothetical protein
MSVVFMKANSCTPSTDMWLFQEPSTLTYRQTADTEVCIGKVRWDSRPSHRLNQALAHGPWRIFTKASAGAANEKPQSQIGWPGQSLSHLRLTLQAESTKGRPEPPRLVCTVPRGTEHSYSMIRHATTRTSDRPPKPLKSA